MSDGSQLDKLFERYVTEKTSPEEKERIEVFLGVMRGLGMLHIEEEYEDALFILLSSPDFNRINAEFFVKACGTECFSDQDALDVISKWRRRI